MTLGEEIRKWEDRIDNERRILANIGEQLAIFGRVISERPDLVDPETLTVTHDPMYSVSNSDLSFARCLESELIRAKLEKMREAEEDLKPLLKQRDDERERLGLG